MEVRLIKYLLNLDGTEVKDASGKVATVKGVILDALLATYKDEMNLSGEEKVRRWDLALRLNKTSDPCEVSADEIVLMKNLVGKAYGPLVTGQVWATLEGKENAFEK